MLTDADSSKLNGEDCPSKAAITGFMCGECGKKFQKPIVATISTRGQIERYYACPRCMAKVKNIKTSGSSEQGEFSISNIELKKLGAEPENMVKCEHFFGYLRKREKETPIPEECLTCNKMFECVCFMTRNRRINSKSG